MKTRYRQLCWFLLGVLGLTGCSCAKMYGSPIPDIVCEYGCPHAELKIEGKVTDKASKPIQGIQVGVQGVVAQTDEQGKFLIGDNSFFPGTDVTLRAEDIDGENNGGLFKSQEVNVKLTKVKEGDGRWYDGAFEAEAPVEIVLEKEQ